MNLSKVLLVFTKQSINAKQFLWGHVNENTTKKNNTAVDAILSMVLYPNRWPRYNLYDPHNRNLK